uniref:Uncharacterized protein n=1 Tax=Heliothis virescens TaxID=7102 RepID=A0A2A4J338_HELVI
MSRFIVILAFAILAQTLATPATNYGNSDSSNGGSGLAVVDGSNFGNGAFSNGGQTPHDKKCGILGTLISTFLPICKNK